MIFKNLKKEQWPIYAFWISNFIIGFELTGSILIPFFKEWGGLQQAQIQIIQRRFMFWIFILEIPTGILGDKKGIKASVILGTFLIALSHFIYIITPDFRLFLFAELIMALGVAFTSGSNSAWLYDLTKGLGLQQQYRKIQTTFRNFYLLGMLTASFLTPWFTQRFPLPFLFASKGFTTLFSMFILILIPKPKIQN